MHAKMVLILALAGLLLISPILGSCSQEVSAQEITNNVLLKYPSVDTFKMNMNMTMTMDIESNGQQMKFDADIIAVGAFKLVAKEMQMGMDMEMNISGQSTKAFAEYYVVNDKAYVNMKMTTLGLDQWFKMDVPEKTWDSQNQLNQQVEFLKNAVGVTKLGEETVDGVATYVLQVGPDPGTIFDWFKSQQQSGSPGLDYSKIDFTKIFKDVSIKMWIAKDTSLPIKEEIQMTMELTPQDLGADASETGKATINMSAQVKYYDYGKPITIELPPKALDAPLLPSS